MISATCDEFLKSLCDCMDLAESNLGNCNMLFSFTSTRLYHLINNCFFAFYLGAGSDHVSTQISQIIVELVV